MIYDDIAANFIKIAENLKRDVNVIIEMKMSAYVYNEYGDKDATIYDNVIINLPKIENMEK